MAIGSKDFMSTQTGGEGETIQSRIEVPSPEQFTANIAPQTQQQQTTAPIVEQPNVTVEQPAPEVIEQQTQIQETPILSEQEKIYSDLGLIPIEIEIPEEVVKEEEVGVFNEPKDEPTIIEENLPEFTPDGIIVASASDLAVPKNQSTPIVEPQATIESDIAALDEPDVTPDGIPVFNFAKEEEEKRKAVETKYEGISVGPKGNVSVKKLATEEPKQEYPTYKLPNSDALYQKRGDKWFKNAGDGKFVPLTKGNVKQRSEYLDNNAVPVSELGTGTKNVQKTQAALNQRVGNLRNANNESIITAGGDPVVTEGLSFNALTRGNIGGKDERYNQDGTLNFNYQPNTANIPREAAAIIDYKGKDDGIYKYPDNNNSYKKENGKWYIKPKGSKEYMPIEKGNVAERIHNLETKAILVPKVKNAVSIAAAESKIYDPLAFDPTYKLVKEMNKNADVMVKDLTYRKAYDDASNFVEKDFNLLLGDNLSQEQKEGLMQYQTQLKEIMTGAEYDPIKAAQASKILREAEQYFDTAKDINKSINEAAQNGVSMARLQYDKKRLTAENMFLTGKETSEFSQEAFRMFEATSEMADFFIENTENGKLRFDSKSGQYVISKNISERERQYLDSKMGELLANYEQIQNERYGAVNNQISRYKKSLSDTRYNIKKIEQSLQGMRNSGVSVDDPKYVALASELNKQRKSENHLISSIDSAELTKAATFLTEPRKVAASAAGNMSQDAKNILSAIPSDIAPKERFDLFYSKLYDETRKLMRDNNISEGRFSGMNRALKDLLDWDGFYALSDAEKKAAKNIATLRQLAPLYYNNDTGVTQDSAGFFESFMNSFMGTLFPVTSEAAGFTNQTEAVGKMVQTFAEEGISEEDFADPEKLEKLNERLNVDFYTREKIGGMLGTTAGIIVPIMATAGVPVSSLRVIKRVERLLTGVDKASDTVGLISKAEKVYDTALSSNRVGRFLKPAIESGIKFETAGNIFGSAEEELYFLSGFAGGVASEALSGIISKLPKEQIYGYLNGIFGSQTNRLVNVMKRTGEASARGVAETGEEFAQEVTNIYRDTDSFKGMMAELSNRFGSFDQVQEFIISSFVMGAAFGIVDGNQGKEVLAKMPEAERTQVNAALSEIRSALTDADEAVNEFVDNKEKQKEVNQKIEEYDKAQEEILNIFDSNKELSNIGTKEQYSKYIDAIFPNSKVKTVLSHGSNVDFQNFDEKYIGTGAGDLYGKGFYFSVNTDDRFSNRPFQKKVIINLTNPIIHKEAEVTRYQDKTIEEWHKDKNHDGVIIPRSDKSIEYVVFDPSKIHILGSNDDVQGFKNFISNQTEADGSKNITGVSGEVAEGQELVEEQPITETGQEAPSPSGMVQEEQTGVEPVEERVTATSAEEAKALWDQGYRPSIEGMEIRGGKDMAIDNIFNTRQEVEMTRMVTPEPEAQPTVTEPEVNEEAKVVDDGVEAFHSTYADFDQFDAGKSSENSRDFGFHFGSTDAAKKRAKDVAESAKAKGEEVPDEATSKTIRAKLNIKNPLRLPEDRIGDFSPVSILKRIFKSMDESGELIDGFTQEEVDGFFNDDLQFNGSNIIDTIGGAGDIDKQSKILREYLESKGYDGIVYKNEFEGGGDSYVAFRPEQIQIVEKKQTFGKPSDSESLINEKENEYAVTEDSLLGGERGTEINNILKSNVEHYSLGLLNSFEAYDQLPNSEKDKFTEEEKAKIENLRTIWGEKAKLQAEAETKQKTTKQRAYEKLAEKVREFKLKPGDLTGGDSGIVMSSLGAKGFEKAWNTAVEAIAQTIVVSGNSAEAIQKAIDAGFKAIKQSDWYKSLTTEQKKQAAADYNEGVNKMFPKEKLSKEQREGMKDFKEKVAEATGTAKPKKTVQRTALQALKDSIRDRAKGWSMGRKNLQDIKEQIRDFAKENLPKDEYSKKEVNTIMNAITNAKTPKGLEQALSRVENMVNRKLEGIRKKTIKDIQNKVSSKRTLFTKRGNKWVGKVSVDAQKEFLDFINSPALLNLENKTQQELDAINDVIDGILSEGKADYKAFKAAEHRASRERAAKLIEGLARGKETMLSGIDAVRDWLDKGNVVIINGEMFRKSDLKSLEYKKAQAERKRKALEKKLEKLAVDPDPTEDVKADMLEASALDAEIRDLEAQLEEARATEEALNEASFDPNASFVGYQQEVTSEVREAEKKTLSRLRGLNPINAINDIYSLLKTAYSGSSAVTKFVKENLEKAIKKAYFERMKGYQQKVADYYDNLADIFGSKKKGINYLSDRASVNPSTSKIESNLKDVPTNGHMVDWYNLIKTNENGEKRMEAGNKDPKAIIDYVESDPKLKAYADYLLREYNETLRLEYEPVYESYTNTPFGDTTYYPSYADGFEDSFVKENEVFAEGGQWNMMSATSRNLKQRTNYSGPFNTRLDAHAKFLDYVKTMEHAKHFMPIAKSANELFSKINSAYLVDSMGVKNYDELKAHLSVILGDTPIASGGAFDSAASTFRQLAVVSTLGLKLSAIAKQFTSFTHFWTAGIELGVDPWDVISAVPKNRDELEFAAFIITSPYVKDRYEGTSMDIEIRALAEKAFKSKGDKVWQNLSKKFLWPVRTGDRSSLTLGGGPFSLAVYRKALKDGMSPEQARDYAYEQFVTQSEASQQSTRPDFTSLIQRDPVFRTVAMYRTGQMANMKKVVNGIKTIQQAHKIQKREGGNNPIEGINIDARREAISDRELVQALTDVVYYSTIGSWLFNAVAGGALYYMFASDTDDDDRKRMVYDLAMGQVSSNLQGMGAPGFFAEYIFNSLRNEEWKNNVPGLRFAEELATVPSRLIEAKLRTWPLMTIEQRRQWLIDNEMPFQYKGFGSQIKQRDFEEDFADNWLYNKMTDAEKDKLIKDIGAGNINKMIDGVGKYIEGNSTAIQTIMMYEDDYFGKNKEFGKRDLLFELLYGEPYIKKDKQETIEKDLMFPEVRKESEIPKLDLMQRLR